MRAAASTASGLTNRPSNGVSAAVAQRARRSSSLRTIDGCEAFEHAAAERLVELEQRAVALGQRERPVGVASADPCRRGCGARTAARSISAACDTPAGERPPRRGRTTRQLGAAARLVCPASGEQQPLACGADGERELQRLGIGSASAQRQRPAAGRVQRCALVVEQERILARRRREGALGQAEHADGAEAQVRGCALTSSTFTPRRPNAPCCRSSRSPALSARTSARTSVEEALEVDRRYELVELRERVEVPEHVLAIAGRTSSSSSPECREALAPTMPARAVRASSAAKSSMKREQALAVVDARARATRARPARGRGGLALACDQRREPRAPLIEALDDAGAARGRIPARRRRRRRSARASPWAASRP